MQADVVVSVGKLLHFALGDEVVVVTVVLALLLCYAAPTLADAV